MADKADSKADEMSDYNYGDVVLDQTDEDGSWLLKATAWELCALSFRYPSKELVDAVVSGEWASAATEIADAIGFKLSPGWDEGLSDYADAADSEEARDALFHRLRAEATRLFIGNPDAVVSPYEGIWRANDEGVEPLLFVNPHSMEVERFAHACGLGQPEGTNEPLDYIATECELLQWICLVVAGAAEPAEGIEPPEGSWKAAYTSFLDEHVRSFAPRFAASVEQETREAFYRAAAKVLGAVVDAA